MSFREVQSLWEVPSIFHFCSLFGKLFIEFDFSIEDLEDALVNNRKWVEILIVRILKGIHEMKIIENYNYYLRRSILKRRDPFYRKPLDHPLYDMDFFELSLASKAEVLHELCMLRLDKARASKSSLTPDFSWNRSAFMEQIRLQPFGCVNSNVYWYFGGRRLYCEKATKHKTTSWHVVCSTSEDWFTLRERLSKGRMKSMMEMHAKIAELCDRRDFADLFYSQTRMREQKQLQMLGGRIRGLANFNSPKEISQKGNDYRLTENVLDITTPKNKKAKLLDSSENRHLETKQQINMTNKYRTRLREINK